MSVASTFYIGKFWLTRTDVHVHSYVSTDYIQIDWLFLLETQPGIPLIGWARSGSTCVVMIMFSA